MASTSKASAPLTFDLKQELLRKIEDYQKKAGIRSKSEVIRDAIDAYDYAGFEREAEPHRQISVRLPVAQKRELLKIARQRKVSLGELLRAALESLPDAPKRAEGKHKPKDTTVTQKASKAKKPAAKKPAAKKAPAKKPAAKKAPVKSTAAAKKAPAKKPAAKKAPAKKAVAKKAPAKKAVAKKAPAKKAVAKKAPAKKAVAKKAPAKIAVAKKAPAKKAVASKTVASKAKAKAPAKKAGAKSKK